MKKVFLSLALVAGISATASAQATFGVKAGVVAADVTGDDVSDTENRFGFQVGGAANIAFSDLISFQPELLYSQKGFQIKDFATTTFHYIDLPLLLNVNAGGLFFEGGPQLGYLAGQTTKFESSAIPDVTDTEGLRKLDIGYIAGLGYKLESGLSVGIRYNGGITSLDDEGDAKARNSAFQFQLGYFFGGK